MVTRQRASYAVTARSAAPVERVFALLADSPGWSEWGGPLLLQSWWEREGASAPGGVGAIRRLGWRRLSSREEIVEYDPPHHLAYVWLTSVVRDYRADVTLEPDGTGTGAGTLISWSGSFEPTVLAPAAVTTRLLSTVVGGFARRLAARAEKEQ